MAAKKPRATDLTASRMRVADLRLAPNVRTASVDEAEQAEFEESIKLHGVLHPVLIRISEVDGLPEIVDGQRRFNAAVKHGLDDLPVYLSAVSESTRKVVQLISNMQRSGMHVLDTAAAVWDIYNDEAGGSADLVATMLNKHKSWVSKMLRLGVDLPEKFNSVARGLMMGNKLADVQMAYTLCQIEEASKPDAERIGKEISDCFKAERDVDLAGTPEALEKAKATLATKVKHTRATLTRALGQIRAAAKPASSQSAPAQGGGGPEDESQDEANPTGGDARLSSILSDFFSDSDMELVRFIRHIVTEAVVSGGQLGAKQQATALLNRILAD